MIFWADKNGFEHIWADDFGISEAPKGKKQFDGGYCDQFVPGEDYSVANYYYPIEGSSQYIRVGYSV